MGRYGTIDYSVLTKRSFLLGAGLFLVGVLGELVGHVVFGSLPGWEETLLINAVIAGILIGLLGPLFFGVVLPLTE